MSKTPTPITGTKALRRKAVAAIEEVQNRFVDRANLADLLFLQEILLRWDMWEGHAKQESVLPNAAMVELGLVESEYCEPGVHASFHFQESEVDTAPGVEQEITPSEMTIERVRELRARFPRSESSWAEIAQAFSIQGLSVGELGWLVIFRLAFERNNEGETPGETLICNLIKVYMDQALTPADVKQCVEQYETDLRQLTHDARHLAKEWRSYYPLETSPLKEVAS